MEKKIIDPWLWGKYTNSAQAVEVTNAQSTLYCSGQAAIDAEGKPSAADMRTQLQLTIANLEQLIVTAGYSHQHIVRLNVYTTSLQEFFATCMDVYVTFIQAHGIEQATSLLEVKALYATLTIELEATLAK